MKRGVLFLLFSLSGCVGINITPPESFTYKEIQTDIYRLAAWEKITDNKLPIHIYIEGDGNAFNKYGRPTKNPTPRSNFLRKIAFNDSYPNVIYLARPCQYILDSKCSQQDWTTGRFSQNVIDSTSQAIKQISDKQSVILIGYSGGAMVSGLVITQHPELKIDKWITIAGVLNHKDWTEYFDDLPLADSVNLTNLPNVKQTHFVGEKDKVVPLSLSKKWIKESNIIIVPNATHDDFGNIKIFD